jgi:hypothetical protein
MKIDHKIIHRFDQLISRVDELMKSRVTENGGVTRYPGGGAIVHESKDHLDEALVTQWAINSLHTLSKVFGKESAQYEIFSKLVPSLTDYSKGTRTVQTALAVLRAAKEDLEHGYLISIRMSMQAEVLDDLIGQASQFLDEGYYPAAALVAGIALEEGLRRHCLQNNVELRPKAIMSEMNNALIKAKLYGSVIKARISAFAEIRNKAAHGQWKEFTANDVEDMINWVRIFMENSFGNARLSLQ